jgi:putative MATE family efflux protein
MMASSVLLSISLTLESALRADKNTLTPMWITLAVTVVKVGLNAILIFGALGAPRLELVGAGLATLGAQVIALVIFFAVLANAPDNSPIAFRLRALASSGPLLRDVVRLALPGVAERLVMNLGMLIYFSVLSRYGAVAVAVYTVGIRLLSFSWIPGAGIAAAAATLVGQSLGDENREGARRAGWRAARLSIWIAVVLGALCAIYRHELAALFTDDLEIVRGLGPFMLCLALAQPAMQLHFTLAGVHRGAGDTWTPLISAALANWAFRVPLAWLFAYVLELPLIWVWMALITDHVTRAVWLLVSFRRGRWLARYTPTA